MLNYLKAYWVIIALFCFYLLRFFYHHAILKIQTTLFKYLSLLPLPKLLVVKVPNSWFCLLPLPKLLVVKVFMNLLIYTGVGNLWPAGRIRPAHEKYPARNIFTNCGNPVASGYSIHSAIALKACINLAPESL